MDLTPRRRRALSTALALLLAIESVTVVAAAARTSVAPPGPHALPEASPAGIVLAESSAQEPGSGVRVVVEPGARVSAPAMVEPEPMPAEQPAAGAATIKAPIATPARASMPDRPARTARVTPASTRSTTSRSTTSRSTAAHGYAGRNHLWIPALRINRSVSAFSCDRTRPPDNLVYRWGCGGTNNVYLMGHAYSVFKPLHDAYDAGHLRVGMKAWYADAKGRVHVYAVKWWKVTRPTTGASWAWASQGRPSMTLQTCVGANSQYRLMVRLVEVDG